jgi:ketosteroid isomerase-like protein
MSGKGNNRKERIMKVALPLLLTLLIFPLLATGQTNKPVAVLLGTPVSNELLLQNLEREWARAVQDHDTNKIDRIQAEEYAFTDPGGRVWTKARALDTIQDGALEIDSFELSDFQTRIYGETAVVRFQVVWNGRFRGTDISGPQRMTDVFVKRDGRWQCVASQATRIAQP